MSASIETKPRLFFHNHFALGTDQRSDFVDGLAKRHKKMIIFTNVLMVEFLSANAARYGHKVWSLTGHMSRFDRQQTIEEFDKAESGIIVVSAQLSTGWRVDATAILFTALRLPALGHFPQMLGRTKEKPREIRIIDYYFPMDKEVESRKWIEECVYGEIPTTEPVAL